MAGRHVAVIEDRDKVGSRHANEVCGSLLNHALTVLGPSSVAGEGLDSVSDGALRRDGVTDPNELREAFWSSVACEPAWVKETSYA